MISQSMAREYGPLGIHIAHVAGNNQRIDFRGLTARQFEGFWRVSCLSGFLIGREAARRLVPLGRGTVIFTGARPSPGAIARSNSWLTLSSRVASVAIGSALPPPDTIVSATFLILAAVRPATRMW